MARLHPLILLGHLVLGGCTPELTKISSRNPDLFEKERDVLKGVGRGPEATPTPEVYIRQKQVTIEDAKLPNETGSLFNPDDERNHLFTTAAPVKVGRFVTINVVANRTGANLEAAKSPKSADDATASTRKPDELEAELLKALPDLSPAQKGDPQLQQSFKMQIAHRYANGDALARLVRRSVQGEEAHEIAVEAKIPFERLTSGDPLTTADLTDVRLVESNEGELLERRSFAWEDEYSLRLSGFTEAKSKAARELEDQRKSLAEAREKLETRIKTFGDERRQVAAQREELTRKKAEAAEQVANLEGKVKERDQTIEDQKETIDEQQQEIQQLKPEEKPGDDKEGKGG